MVCYIVVRVNAVNDQESAEECIKENKILRNIARHCVDETEGLFITLPEDSLDYQKPSSKVVPNPVLKRSPLILNLPKLWNHQSTLI